MLVNAAKNHPGKSDALHFYCFKAQPCLLLTMLKGVARIFKTNKDYIQAEIYSLMNNETKVLTSYLISNSEKKCKLYRNVKNH